MIKSIIVVFVLTVGFTACKGLKEAPEPPPVWVQSPPRSSVYYIGIGSSSKSGLSPDEYIQRAKNNALRNLSSSISVTISSTSMLSVIESNDNISESFINEIKASTEQHLEGYEQVENWEDRNNYWVYYQLSKSEYINMRNAKKNEALKTAWNKYNQAFTKIENASYYEAWTFLADAMVDIKPYMNESTDYQCDNTTIDMGSSLYSGMLQIVNSLEIIHPQQKVHVTRGIKLDRELLTFYVKDTDGNIAKNIPVNINYSGKGLLKNRERSDQTGAVVCQIEKLKSQNSSELISVSLDMTTMSYATRDPLVRKVIKQIPVSKTQLTIIVEKPIIEFSSNEILFDKELANSKLLNSLQRTLSSEIQIGDTTTTPDYKILIESNTKTSHNDEYYYYAESETSLIIRDNKNQVILQKKYNAEGEGESYKKAGEDAYAKLEMLIERKAYRDIISVIF